MPPLAFPPTILAVAGFVAVLGACATPSRRLPPRVVDDPVTLPRRMMEVQVLGRMAVPETHEWPEDGVIPSFRYGLTDRLTLDALTGLEWAVLDDAPPDHAATGPSAVAPLSFAVRGGLREWGWSTIEGLILTPYLGAHASKRLGPRLRLGVDASGGSRLTGRGGHAGVHGGWLTTGADLLVQVQARLALTLELYGGWGFDGWLARTLESAPEPTSYWLAVQPGLVYRPFHFVTAGVHVPVQITRHRALTAEPMPEGPLPFTGWTPARPAVVRAVGFARLHW